MKHSLAPPPTRITLPSGREVFLTEGVYGEPRLISAKPLPPSAWNEPWGEDDRRAIAEEMARRWRAWACPPFAGVLYSDPGQDGKEWPGYRLTELPCLCGEELCLSYPVYLVTPVGGWGAPRPVAHLITL